MSSIYQNLIEKKEKLAVVGLGYVEFEMKISVIVFDINEQRVQMMRNRIDPSEELEPEQFHGCDIHFTASPEELKEARFFIVAVPTPIDEHNLPDLKPLLSATRSVAAVLKKTVFLFWKNFQA